MTEHGTIQGYRQHTRLRTAYCEPCREANRVYQHQIRVQEEIIAAAQSIDHGTARGYQQHARLNIPPCEPCRVAVTEQKRRDRAALRNAREHLVAIRRGQGLTRQQREAEVRTARSRALRKLAEEHPGRLAALTNMELRAAGIAP